MMQLDYLLFDPSPCRFPRPRISPLPTGLTCLSLGRRAASTAPSGFFRHYARGRYALHEAYRLAGIGSGNALLAPAYHCRTMLDPALALGGDILLYPLREDLSPDLAALDRLVDGARQPVKALLATHFFGIPQELGRLSDWCAARGITLIEDCSHVLFTDDYRAPNTGRAGTFSAASPYKFFAGEDGGLLYSPSAFSSGSPPADTPWTAEVRALAHLFGAQRDRRHTATGGSTDVDAEVARIAASPQDAGIHQRCRLAGCSAEYRQAQEGLASLRSSRFIARHTDIEKISRRRRNNYRRWVAALAGTPHCRPLFPELPTDCVPYMFPLHIERPDPHFYWLKHLGVPVWRWDSIAASACPTANDYRLRMLHLPCHQSLTEAELEWMIAAVGMVLRHPVPGVA